jgi:hypothetical protein
MTLFVIKCLYIAYRTHFREVPMCSLIAAIFITVLLIMWYK